jgi:ATP-binding protein involved in chromosome partitioning
MPTPSEILETLKSVKYPGFSRDIVSFGIVRDVEVGSLGVNVILAPTTENEEVLQKLRKAVAEAVMQMPGVRTVEVTMTAPATPQRRMAAGPAGIPGVKHIIAVASGKGGVGKSTVAVNLSFALAALGQRVGLLDADVYGPSVPKMLGLRDRPQTTEDKHLVPLERSAVKVISLGLFIEDQTPVIWRGPMITKLLTQFFREVEWGELDILVLDLPPGTGDAQLTITQQVPLTGGVIVTTPQDVALEDVKRGITMFQQVKAPVLGVIENMSYHVCGSCGGRSEPFGHGGGERMATELGVPFLGALPLVRDLRVAADNGTPLVVARPEHPQSQAFRTIAERLLDALAQQPIQALPAIH